MILRAYFIACLCSISAASSAAIVYSNVDPPAIPGFANVDANAVMLDDIAIPIARLGGATLLDVTKIDFKVFAPQAGTYTIRSWYSQAVAPNNQVQPSTPTQISSHVVNFPGNNQHFEFSIGNGADVLFRAQLLSVTNQGQQFRLMYLGLSFSHPLSNIGWLTADGPDFNENTFWKYYGPNDPRNGITTLGGGQHGSFHVVLHGNPVPEPCTLVALGVLCLFVRRRRSD